MIIELTWQSVAAIGGVVAAITAIITLIFKFVRWVDKTASLQKEIESIKEEQQILVYGMLACLRGLKEQGCDGPVTDAINKLEKYLNVKAHKDEA